jgi:flagellar basal body-associated protein FliL
MKVKGKRVLRRFAVVLAVAAALAAFGLVVWFGSGTRVYDREVEYLEDQGLTHAEAERKVDEMKPIVEFAKGAQMIKR